MKDKTTTIQDLKEKVEKFIEERDWKQFHTPKNMSMALAKEAAELMDLFLWVESSKSTERYKEKEEQVKNEISDIITYALAFCNITGIDLTDAFENKMKLNIQKYPIEKCKGKSLKYNEL